jgi:Plasmid pRiA4b ORF-3-like protein
MAGRVYQLKATIVGTKPPVWRRVLVEEAASLLDLHFVLQGAFGWYDGHLHEFEIDNVRYGTDDGEGWGPPPKSERRRRLGAFGQQGTTIKYVYDFGDDWVHRVIVEKVELADPDIAYPACIGGRPARLRTAVAYGDTRSSSTRLRIPVIRSTNRCSSGLAVSLTRKPLIPPPSRSPAA